MRAGAGGYAPALARDAWRDAGAAEVILVPTSTDPDELARTVDAIAAFV